MEVLSTPSTTCMDPGASALSTSYPSDPNNSHYSLLSPSLWIPELLESSTYVSAGPEFFAHCLAYPECTVHYRAPAESFTFLRKNTLSSGISIQENHSTKSTLSHASLVGGSGDQDDSTIHNDMQTQIFVTRGYACRKQGLGRRLCFIDIVSHASILENGFPEGLKHVSGDANGDGVNPSGEGPSHWKELPRTAKDISSSRGVCLSFFSPLLGDIDVHRSILRRVSTGDFVEAVGVMEKRKEDSLIQHVRSLLVESTGGNATAIESALRWASNEFFRNVQCLFSFKVLSVRASKQQPVLFPLSFSCSEGLGGLHSSEADRTNTPALRIKGSVTEDTTIQDTNDIFAEFSACCLGESVDKETQTRSATEEPPDLKDICKHFLISGHCCRKNCSLLHLRSSSLRRLYDVLKAQRQVQRVKQQLGEWRRQHTPEGPSGQCETLGSNEFSSGLKGTKCAYSEEPVHNSPFFRRTEQCQKLQSLVVYPKSRRAEVFADWLVSTYGIERLRSGEGVIDVAGGRGELAFELTMRYGIPCCIIDPRCTYTSKSLAVQPPDVQHQWFKAHSGKAIPRSNDESCATLEASRRLPLESFDLPTSDLDSRISSQLVMCTLSGQALCKPVSAMVSGSKRAFECPLKLTRRQADWLRRHRGLRGIDAESFFHKSVETIPAIFSAELVKSSSYVMTKLLNASAIVGLHPDEATGSILEVGLMVEALRKQTSACVPLEGMTKSKEWTGVCPHPTLNCSVASPGHSRINQCWPPRNGQSSIEKTVSPTLMECCSRSLALAVVPCCVFSDVFPDRRIPLHALVKVVDTTCPSGSTKTKDAIHGDPTLIPCTKQHNVVTDAVVAGEVEPRKNIPLGVEKDGTLLVRTYEELLIWLLLLDPQRRLKQETLPVVGKNQVIFLPP